MMRRLLILLVALCSTPLAAQPSDTERLISPALSDFVEGFAKSDEEQSIREEIPRGESIEAWTRMVTTQRFVGLAQRVTPDEYVRNIFTHIPTACPGAQVSQPVSLIISGRKAAQFQVDCPDSSGSAETFILLAIAGRSDMHVKQVAWRGAIAPALLSWGRDFLSKVTLCGVSAPCPR